MLFSEPKIPQSLLTKPTKTRPACFSALQRAENSSIYVWNVVSSPTLSVSVLFSEPKIPQFSVDQRRAERRRRFQCSSASRKFLNCAGGGAGDADRRRFSALQRAENSSIKDATRMMVELGRFSALQRAENSSICTRSGERRRQREFQCSSASRKFLNGSARGPAEQTVPFQCSSASRKFLNVQLLARRAFGHRFQCSSASRKFLNMDVAACRIAVIEFQCSSASRKFLNPRCPTTRTRRARVSVLFSEPKIPQFVTAGLGVVTAAGFSALQRAENSSIGAPLVNAPLILGFSALQRAENSSIDGDERGRVTLPPFQCSSASRKFLNHERDREPHKAKHVSVLFSEPKIPQSKSGNASLIP